MQQYILNAARSYIYPWVYGEGSFEANEIVPGLWLGNWASAHDKVNLKKHGITHILCAIYNTGIIYPDEFTYLSVPVIDSEDEICVETMRNAFDSSYNFIQDALDKKGSVLVHCVYGVSRSSTIVCAYLMKKYKSDTHTMLTLIKNKRPCIQPNTGFIKLLNNYYQDCVKDT